MTVNVSQVLKEVLAGESNYRSAQRLDIAPSTVKRWLDGDTTPTYEVLSKLIKEYRLDPAIFFGKHNHRKNVKKKH